MTIFRPEVRTGVFVLLTIVVLVAVLLYLGAPGTFVPQNTYRIYVDNAAGLKQGADVLLAGRRVGQVVRLYSPVPEAERPEPKAETMIEVSVAKEAKIYRMVNVHLTSHSMLGEMLIDFTNGQEASGLARDGDQFLGKRPPGLDQAVPMVLDKIDPALKQATETLTSLQKTADNLTKLTAEGGEVTVAVAEFKQFGTNLKDMSGPESSLRKSLLNVEEMTSEGGKLQMALTNIGDLTDSDSSLSKTLANAEKFTKDLSNNDDIEKTLRNFRMASERLNATMGGLGPQFTAIAGNLEQATDTVKRQPWRLIWPSTKKYPAEAQQTGAVQRQTIDPRKAPAQKESRRSVPIRKAREIPNPQAARKDEGKSPS